MTIATYDDLDKLSALVKAMTPGPLAAKSINGTDKLGPALAYFEKAYLAGAGPLHAVLFPLPPGDSQGDTHLIVALTGNGPTSEANAVGIVALLDAADELIRLARIGLNFELPWENGE